LQGACRFRVFEFSQARVETTDFSGEIGLDAVDLCVESLSMRVSRRPMLCKNKNLPPELLCRVSLIGHEKLTDVQKAHHSTIRHRTG
jgi:hypothetical protein